MTAAWHHLTSPWALLCLGLYAACVVVILVVNHGAHRKPASWTDLTLAQPPVPTQADVDSTWLAAWPAGDDDEIALRFDQIIAAEGPR